MPVIAPVEDPRLARTMRTNRERAKNHFLDGVTPRTGAAPPPGGAGGLHHGPLCGAAAGPGVLGRGVGAIPTASTVVRNRGHLPLAELDLPYVDSDTWS